MRHVTLRRMYASPGKRAIALFLDVVIIGILMVVAPMSFVIVLGGGFSYLVLLAILALYFAGFPLTKWQSTPGKHVCGLKITDLRGGKIGVARSLLRFAAGILSLATLFIGYAVMVWNGKHQALHDFIARTVVVDDKAPASQIAGSEPPIPSWTSRLAGTAVFALLLALPYYVYLYPLHGQLASETNDHNMKETLPVVAALEAYKLKNGRYPESLAPLYPGYLARPPRLRERARLQFTSSPAADQCWLAIVFWMQAGFILPADRVNEYECRSRTWTNLDYSELNAKDPGRIGEPLAGAGPG